MPAWTFAASACAVAAAGLLPRFVDVGAQDWMADPERAAALLRAHAGNIGALMVVPPAGTRTDLAPWQALAGRYGVALVVDSADGFDIVRPCSAPQVISMHAVKAFGIGEGGCVVSTDAKLIAHIRKLANFGIGSGRVVDAMGINGKLSEYGAAVGLAALDEWPRTRARWRARSDAYRSRLAAAGRTLLFQEEAVCGTALLDLGAPVAERVATAMLDAGVESRRWWGDGCHRQPAFAQCPADPLPQTERLGGAVLGLPFHVDLADAEVDRVVALLGHCISQVA